MENFDNESQSRNAAKVVGLAAAATLLATATIKSVRFVGRKLSDRKLDKATAPTEA